MTTLTRGKPTRLVVSNDANSSEDEDQGGRSGHTRSEDTAAARRIPLEDTGATLSAVERYTSIKDDNVEGSLDGVDEIPNNGATTSTETSELSAPPVGAEAAGGWIDPDKMVLLEMTGRPREVEASEFDAPSEIRRQSGRVDIQDAVESPTTRKQELLYAAELGMESPGNRGQPISLLSEASCLRKGSFICSRLLFIVVGVCTAVSRVKVPPLGLHALSGCASGVVRPV